MKTGAAMLIAAMLGAGASAAMAAPPASPATAARSAPPAPAPRAPAPAPSGSMQTDGASPAPVPVLSQDAAARARMHECGHQWSSMKKAGTAGILTWKEFSATCLVVSK